MWVVLLIGRALWEFASTNEKHYPDLRGDSLLVCCFSACSPRLHFARTQVAFPQNVGCFLSLALSNREVVSGNTSD